MELNFCFVIVLCFVAGDRNSHCVYYEPMESERERNRIFDVRVSSSLDIMSK